ncbi:TPA: hypothetical protein HA241_03355 [Candidatus Woesearchaeota archaeon]|nr:hypothetical protein [Candidatus Woesearchaeota archaeon]
MGKVISYFARNVIARGLSCPSFPDENKIRSYFFDDDYTRLRSLQHLSRLSICSRPLLFYPGCGVDLFTPLLYLEFLFPEVKEVSFRFVDTEPVFDILLTILDDVGIPFARLPNSYIDFYWKTTLVHLQFEQTNVFIRISTMEKFDIYFEKAFRIMKEQESSFEMMVFKKLNQNGVIISDNGFRQFPLCFLDVPSDLSAYGEMVVGIKN